MSAPRGPVTTFGQSVYVLSVPSGYFKIGIAKDPEGRRRDLQCGNPEPITLVGASQYPWLSDDGGVDPRLMERRLHELLMEYRASGEWFKAPEERLYRAWKLAWMELRHPNVVERWRRMKGKKVDKGIGAAETDGTNSERDRKRRWRARNPEKYRAYQRAYMAKRRAQ